MTGDKRRQLPKDRAPTVVNQPPFADLERIRETRGVKSELFIRGQFLKGAKIWLLSIFQIY